MRKPVAFFLSVFPVLALVYAARAEDAPSPELRPLAVGDRLRYQVVEDGDRPVELAISNTGMVDVPYYGPMKAAGRRLSEVVADIKTELESKLYVTATVRVT